MRIKPDWLVSPFFVGALCGVALCADVVPGKVGYLLLSAFDSAGIMSAIGCLSIVLGAIGWLLWTIVQLARRKIRFWTKRVYWPLISLVLVMLTCTAIAFHIPTKVGFLVSYRQFQRAIVTDSVQTGSQVGLFHLQQVHYPDPNSDPNSKEGVDFKLFSYWNGSSTLHYGISYRPNRDSPEMPFGFVSDQGYDRIWKYWYIFQAGTC
jgi:hypothetical protein